ncbi:alpha/beta hydrolase domain-containing protein [Yinghuangia aomiensis]|uniref:Alpha/beta hydrolase domain-containing protein n=1 Tax=Yinghuangia aomiensis TaxID=676205 RepID=A0ABP9I925_9ACTN
MTQSPNGLEGPVAGGRGQPFSASVIDLAPHGYEEIEYFISGHASRFAPADGATFEQHGRWKAVAGEPTPYRTRILVRRPSPERFNGTVVVEFMQEYFGVERDTNYRWNAETLVREGFAWVGASLHHEGVDVRGRTELSFGDVKFQTGPALAEWDPERYGSLVLPDSDLCYDILSDVGRAVGPDRGAVGNDPLAGLDVRRVLAVGNTIAGARLQQYINAVHPLHQVFDGFFLQDLKDEHLTLSAGATPPPGPWIRTDVDVPTIVLNTTTAAMDTTRQTEGPFLRFWEPAGSSHTTGPFMARVAEVTKRDLDADTPLGPPERANTFPVHYISGAALVALHQWAAGGEAAQTFPVIDRTGEGPDALPPFDEVGNVEGGLRTPWVDVPVARYEWRGDSLGGSGRTFPFSDDELAKLYGTPHEYRRRFAAAAHEAERRGVLLPEDALTAIEDSRKVQW